MARRGDKGMNHYVLILFRRGWRGNPALRADVHEEQVLILFRRGWRGNTSAVATMAYAEPVLILFRRGWRGNLP